METCINYSLTIRNGENINYGLTIRNGENINYGLTIRNGDMYKHQFCYTQMVTFVNTIASLHQDKDIYKHYRFTINKDIQNTTLSLCPKQKVELKLVIIPSPFRI